MDKFYSLFGLFANDEEKKSFIDLSPGRCVSLPAELREIQSEI
jgi:hypothetical protein